MLRVQAGIIVVACSQCTRGSVDIDKYAVGRAFAEKGAGLLAVGMEGTDRLIITFDGRSPR